MNRFTVSLASILSAGLLALSGRCAAAETSAQASSRTESLNQLYAALRTEVAAELAAAPAPGTKPNPYDISGKLRPLLESVQDLHVQGKNEEARQALHKIDLNINNAKPGIACSYYVTEAGIEESLGNRAEAQQLYAWCLRKPETPFPIHLRIAQQGAARTSIEKEEAELKALEKSKDYRGMTQVLRRLVERWPKEVPLQSELAWNLVRAGDGAAAKQVALRTLPLVQRSVRARAVYYNLGRACELLGERDAAISAYRSALYRGAEGLLVDAVEQQLPSEGQLGEIASSLRRMGAFPILPVPELLEPYKDRGPSADKGSEPYCVSANKPILSAPFVGVTLCYPNGAGALDLVVQTTSGTYHKPEYYDLNHGARDDHSVSRVEVKNGRLIIQTRLRRGRWYSLQQEFLTICAPVPSGVSCAGPIDIFGSNQEGRGGKEDFSLGPEVVDYSYRAQLLDGDVIEFTPVKRRKSVDLSGKIKLQFP